MIAVAAVATVAACRARQEPQRVIAAPDTDLITRAPQLEQQQVDIPAMGVQQADPPASPDDAGDLEEVDMGAWLAERYAVTRARLGEPAGSDRPAQVGSVRVAVLDSVAGDFYDPAAMFEDAFGHGRSVGRLIEDVACKDQTPCRVEIRNYAALPLTTSDAGFLQINGSGMGAYGTRAALAEQIELATNEWLLDRKRGAGPDHLVVNLSLGWSGCWNAPNSKPDSDPVWDAGEDHR